MKQLLSIFDLSIFSGNRKMHKDSLGEGFYPASLNVTPSFNTVLPNGVTQWVGEQGTEFKAWCKKFNVSCTYSRFNERAEKPKVQLERYLRGEAMWFNSIVVYF